MEMAQKLSEHVVRELQPPADGNKIYYDLEVRGFGCRVTCKGAKSYVLNFRAGGRERRLTIGSHPDWSLQAARDEARRLKRQVDIGEDPMEARHAERGAATMADAADRFMSEHASRLRPKTRAEYASMMRLYVVPELGRIKVASLRQADIQRLHDRVAQKFPYRANRLVSLLAKLIGWSGERSDNPARDVRLAPEEERERPLSSAEVDRLCDALERLPKQKSADAIRLLLLTGCRKMEACGARWLEFDLAAGTWTKPGGRTKGKKRFSVPISDAAVLLLSNLREEALQEGSGAGPQDFVFAGSGSAGHLADVKSAWRRVTREAGIGRFETRADARGRTKEVWKSDARPHDLRHTFASMAASRSHSLPVVGRLLGQRRLASTSRYAHLADAVLREAVNQIGDAILGNRAPRREKPDGP